MGMLERLPLASFWLCRRASSVRADTSPVKRLRSSTSCCRYCSFLPLLSMKNDMVVLILVAGASHGIGEPRIHPEFNDSPRRESRQGRGTCRGSRLYSNRSVVLQGD